MRPRKYFKSDPYWTKARFISKCSGCSRLIQRGEDIFYYPRTKDVFCNREGCGKHESRHFESAAADEYFYNNQY